MKSKPWWRYLAPAVVSGASENDPTTVASMAVIGATTTYTLGWLVLAAAPMLAIVQAIGAHVAGVRRQQLQDVVKECLGVPAALLLLIPLLCVNLLTLAADLEGGTAALNLLTGADARWFAVPLSAIVAAFLVLGHYKSVRNVLSYVPLAFLAYVGAAFLAHPDWSEVLHGSLVPNLHLGAAAITGAIALLGTILTAYAYVWNTIEVAEEKPSVRLLGVIQLDSAIGTLTAILSALFILIATAATLGVHHRQVETAQQAAQALAPLAGRYATVVFAIGLLGSALLALAVISSTTGYATAAMFGWPNDLDAPFGEAPRFYYVMLSALAIAALCGLFNFHAIQLLYASSIAGGVATPISLAVLLIVGGSRAALGHCTVPVWLLSCGWCVAAIVGISAAAFLKQTL